MITRGKFWNAYYRGWFAARSDRRQPISESMVEHSFVVDGYMDGKSSGGSAASTQIASPEQSGSDASDDSDSSKLESESESESGSEAVDKNAESAE